MGTRVHTHTDTKIQKYKYTYLHIVPTVQNCAKIKVYILKIRISHKGLDFAPIKR